MIELVSPEFSSSYFSLRRIKTSFQPSLKPICKKTVTGILETGLLFREDALTLEDALQLEAAIRSESYKFRFTPGERIISAIVIGVCVAVLPLRRTLSLKQNLYRSLCWTGAGVAVPIIQRYLLPRTFLPFLKTIGEYTFLLRKCISYMKHQLLTDKTNSNMSSLNTLLINQQRELSVLFLNANTILESQFSWLPASSLADLCLEEEIAKSSLNLNKMHHLFLILQSTLLKNVGLAHLSSGYTMRSQKNLNERIYWIHTVLFPTVLEPLENYLRILDRSFRYLKESISKVETAPRALPDIIREPWQYSEIHADVITCSSQLRSALAKCNEIDSFIEACWKAHSKFSPQIFENDLTKLREELGKCFNTIDTVSGRLNKIKQFEISLLEKAVQKLQLPPVEEEETESPNNILTISEDTDIAVVDQVFYFEKKDEFIEEDESVDCMTAPGKKEIKATKLVLEELKIKLVKREDEMRERESIALENTMPEYKGHIPNFPRQLNVAGASTSFNEVAVESNGNHNNLSLKESNGVLNDVKLKESNGDHNDVKLKEINGGETQRPDSSEDESSDRSGFSDDRSGERSSRSSSPVGPLLVDVRKRRVVRKKNFPPSAPSNSTDYSKKSLPMEYKLGTNLAIASLFNAKPGKCPFVDNGEMFIGDGEVSGDSGNENES